MKTLDLFAFIIKISGLILLVISIARMPEYINLLYSDETGTDSLINIIWLSPSFISLAISLLFVFYPYKITTQILLQKTSLKEQPFNFKNLQIISIRLLGLLLLFWSISDIIFHIFTYFMLRDSIGEPFPLNGYNYPFIVATIGEIAFAIMLLVKTKAISNFVNSYENK